jgi:hypothetical protein
MSRLDVFKQHLAEKRCVKVISGIDNYDTEKLKRVVSAADQSAASAVDIAAREDLIYLAKELTDIAVFVSSIDPSKLEMAVREGADAVEIGNYDALYNDGLRITGEEVLNVTKETLNRIGNDVFTCVTVPGHIDIAEQIKLAQELEELGVNLLQTEGAAVANIKNTGARGLLEKANVSIANTIELVRNVNIPVMTASGITPTTAGLAFAAGASAVGIGSCVNKLDTALGMIAVVRSIVETANKNRLREFINA